MELFDNLALGFGVAFTVQNLLYAFGGCFLGTLIGVLPGLGPINGVAILLPLAFALGLPPETALIASTSSSSRLSPFAPMRVSRSSSSTPYASAAARDPPPEKASTRVMSSRRPALAASDMPYPGCLAAALVNGWLSILP